MKRLPFPYTYSMPNFSSQSLDYDALVKNAGIKCFTDEERECVFRALNNFMHLCWGAPPKSESVKTSLLGISTAAAAAAGAVRKLGDSFSFANSAAHVMLFEETGLPLEDYQALWKQSTKLQMISQCAENAAKKVPTLPRGNPGKLEFHSLILSLHAAFDSDRNIGWYTETSDYDVASDSDKIAYSGEFVEFVCEAFRQIKRYLRGASVPCWPGQADVSTDAITKAETNAIGRAIKAARQAPTR
jgi:hypothetical protein